MTTKNTSTASPTEPQSPAAVSVDQQLRGHLATLKLDAAAQALPGVLQTATDEAWTMTQALEHLLAIEVDATDARRLAGRLAGELPVSHRRPHRRRDAAVRRPREKSRDRLPRLSQSMGHGLR